MEAQMPTRFDSAATGAAYHRAREAAECELAVAETDAARRLRHFELAEGHAAMMQAAQAPLRRLARRMAPSGRAWLIA